MSRQPARSIAVYGGKSRTGRRRELGHVCTCARGCSSLDFSPGARLMSYSHTFPPLALQAVGGGWCPGNTTFCFLLLFAKQGPIQSPFGHLSLVPTSHQPPSPIPHPQFPVIYFWLHCHLSTLTLLTSTHRILHPLRPSTVPPSTTHSQLRPQSFLRSPHRNSQQRCPIHRRTRQLPRLHRSHPWLSRRSSSPAQLAVPLK